jgi:hypothetical protein
MIVIGNLLCGSRYRTRSSGLRPCVRSAFIETCRVSRLGDGLPQTPRKYSPQNFRCEVHGRRDVKRVQLFHSFISYCDWSWQALGRAFSILPKTRWFERCSNSTTYIAPFQGQPRTVYLLVFYLHSFAGRLFYSAPLTGPLIIYSILRSFFIPADSKLLHWRPSKLRLIFYNWQLATPIL